MKSRVDQILLFGTLAVLIGAMTTAPACADVSDSKSARIVAAVARADFIFEGRVESVGPPPRFESGRLAAMQSVELIVQEVWQGDLTVGESVVVEHYVVRNSRSAEPGKNELSKTLFRKGTILLVISSLHKERLRSVDEDYGTLEPTQENEVLIREAIRDRESAR